MRKSAPIPPRRADPNAIGRARQQCSRTDGLGGEQAPSRRTLRLPHERDESPDRDLDRERAPSRDVIEQAAEDVNRGLVDTERRGIPSDVPAPRPRDRNRAVRRRRS